MAGIDEVLERLVGDSAFRQALARDPQAALSGYDLTGEDVELLTAQLDEGGGGEHGVEQRTSKSAIAGFLAQAFSGGAGEAAESQDLSVWQSQFGKISTDGPDGGEESHRGVQDISAVKWVDKASSSSSVGQSQFGEPNQAGDGSHKDWIDLLSVSQAHGSEEPAADATTEEADFTGDGAVDAADFLAWQRGNAAEPVEDLAGSQPDDASATPKLYETAAKGAYLSEDSGDPDALTSAEAVPPAEDTAQQSGDPDQPVIIGSVFNGEAGSDASATRPPDDSYGLWQINLAGSEEGADEISDVAPADDTHGSIHVEDPTPGSVPSEGGSAGSRELFWDSAAEGASTQYQESDLEFITDSAPDQAGTPGHQGLGFHTEYKGADDGWYRSEPTVSLGGDDAPPDGTDAAAAAIQAEDPAAAGGPEVEEGEK